jgi:hypothetical protein
MEIVTFLGGLRMEEQSNPPVAATDGVDWTAVTEDVECARCGYNLRGLDRPRCPECGLEFSWEEILNPDRRPHPYLYEHHGDRRKARRLIKTVAASWIPWLFWGKMRMDHPRFPGRLAAYAVWLALIGTVAATLIIWLIATTTAYYAYSTSIPSSVPPLRKPSTMAIAYGEYIRDRTLTRCVTIVAAYLILSAVTVGVMSIFSRSLRRYRILFGHLCRVAIYTACGSGALFIVEGMVFTFPVGVVLEFQRTQRYMEPLAFATTLLAASVLIHWFISLMTAGYYYLRVERWWVVALSCQIIGMLVLANFLVYLY